MKTLTKGQKALSLLYQEGSRDARLICSFLRDSYITSNRDA